MPMGPEPAGFLYFAGVKLLGYTGYAFCLRRNVFDDLGTARSSRTLTIGVTRTAIGLAAGAAYGGMALFTHFFDVVPFGPLVYMLGLFPIRLLEWWFLLWLFFRAKMKGAETRWAIGGGILVSYVLDGIGIAAALVIPGGIWVC